MRVVGYGEVMLRISTNDDFSTPSNNIYFGGAEFNVLCNLSSLGIDSSFATTLPNNNVAKRICKHANSFGVNTSLIKFDGEKLGMYYTLLGNMYAPTVVYYDRKYSSFWNNPDTNINFSKTQLLHVSGVTAALNQDTRNSLIKQIKEAKKQGTAISYDSNYRAKLWSQEEAGEFLKDILPYVDIAFLGILDLKHLLNIECNTLEEGYKKLVVLYPNLKYIASTNRNIINQESHIMSGNLFVNNKMYTSKSYGVQIKERIGTGDSFAAGILYGILNDLRNTKIVEFAMANCVLKHQHYGDNYHANYEQIMNLISSENNMINR